MAWSLSLGGLMLDKGESAGGRVEPKDGDAVVAAIGGIDKFAGRVNGHLRPAFLASEGVRQRRNGLQLPQRAARRIVSKRGQSGSQLVNRKHQFAIWMNGQVSRAGGRLDGNKGRVIGRQSGPG